MAAPASTPGATAISGAPEAIAAPSPDQHPADETPPKPTAGPIVLDAPEARHPGPMLGPALWLTGLSTAIGTGLTGLLAAGFINVWLCAAGILAWVAGSGVFAGQHLARPYRQLAVQLARNAKSRSQREARGLPTQRGDEIGQIARAFVGLIETADRDARQLKNLRRTLDDRVQRGIEKATRSLCQQIHRDPMTGVGNRRFLDDELDKLVDLSLTGGTSLLAIAIDLDHFKSVNDTLGHEAGDQLIKLAAELMRQGLRQNDLVIRQGGDEFVVLMPTGTHEAVQRYTHDLRTRFVQQATIRFSRASRTPNMSIGVAALNPKHHRCGNDLLRSADQALYTAKRQGRGRTVGLASLPQHPRSLCLTPPPQAA